MDVLTQLPENIAFRHRGRALKNLESLRPVLPESATGKLSRFLQQMPDPDAALNYLQRYLVEAGHPPESILRPSRRLHAMLALFSHSHFLSDAVVRYRELVGWALDEERLYRVLSNEEMYSALGWSPAVADDAQMALALARFKRMHLVRIALRDLLGLATLAEVTLELSNLADTIIHGAHEYLRRQLIQKFGRPLSESGSVPIECQFVVLGLGKLGGRELNYSSDIDLMYLYTGDGATAGPIKIPNRDFIFELAERLTKLLSIMTVDGFCYRVDLRLRPDGNMGELVLPLQATLDYYHRRGRDWELQMLIKARPTAGAFSLGHTFLKIVDPMIYQTTTDFSNVERVAETRDRIQQKLRHRSKPAAINVKLARGGIRDIEFLVQCFQRLYGGKDAWLRSGGTLFALHRLRDKGYLSLQDYSRLDSAYQFLRTVEHLLQIEDDRQVHALPSNGDALALLTRKVRAKLLARPSSEDLHQQVTHYLKDVTEVYERVIHSQRPTATIPADHDAREANSANVAGGVSGDTAAIEDIEHSWRTQLRHLERESPALAQAVQGLPLRRGRKHFEFFLNKVVSLPRLLREFEQLPSLVECAADLIEYSPYLAESLIRYPEDVLDIKAIAQTPRPGEGKKRAMFCVGERPEMPAEMRAMLDGGGSFQERSMWLRRFYRRRMLRLLTESVCRRTPIFVTLAKQSELADHIIQAAYEIAVDSQCRSTGRPRPEHALRVIALGRLGTREFDVASDADLVFVLPDEAASEKAWWTDVVSRMIDVISSYTVEGMIFSVDPRLRPMGRDGELVQTEAAYKAYFAGPAQPWEALTYMKSRAVAGDIKGGTQFLTALQDVDWRRYGMSGDLARLLLDMRGKLEREQGSQRPIKAGAGGYYDLDFILMYLRLRDAGIFFESLSTPERIEVIQALGRLSDKQAKKLQDTAVFFRALDHAIRISTGHSSSQIPSSLSKQEILAELIGRWSSIKPAAQPLPSFVQQVRQATRRLFLEIFETAGSDS